jgi:hypothetical protein
MSVGNTNLPSSRTIKRSLARRFHLACSGPGVATDAMGLLADFKARAQDALCFTGETPICMAGGFDKPIEEIQVGDYVRSCNLNGDQISFEFGRVLRVMKRKVNHLRVLHFYGKLLRSTEEHPFYLVDHGTWIKAKKLQEGNLLLRGIDETIALEANEEVFGEFTVFNIEVERHHNYYAQGVLVHNCNAADAAVNAFVPRAEAALPLAVPFVAPAVIDAVVGAAIATGVVGKGKDGGGSEEVPKLLEQKATGRTEAKDLKEKLAMEEAMANPGGSHAKGVNMKDPRYPAKDGWIKMEQEVNGVKIHYIKNTITGAVADFKFK